MPLILGAQSAVATGFDVDNSCRFNDDDGVYLSITPGAGNQKTATWSVWCKYTTQGHDVWGAYDDATHFLFINFNSNGTFEFRGKTGGYVLTLETDAEYRDPAAWYHVVCTLDTTESVEADRAKIWINGVQLTSFSLSNYPSLNADMEFNTSSHPTRIGDGTGAPERTPYDGYMAEFGFIDGTAYEASDFGEFDEDSPTIWKPTDPSGLTFGTNGYYLDFQDSADLGNDVSGEGNDFASTNLTAADQGTDSPTNNFSTLNPLEYMGGSSPTFSEGNCQYVQGGSSQYYPSSGTVGLTAGKWYWEVQTTDGAKNGALHGIAGDAAIGANMSSYSNQVLGYTAQQWAISAVASGYRNNNGYTAYGVGFYGNVIVGVYLDLDNNKLYFASGGTIMQSGTGIDITAAASTNARYYVPSSSYWGGTDTFQYNFGGCSAFAITSAQQDANGYGNFEYSPNDGGSSSFDSSAKDFLAICTKNLGSDGG